MPSTAISNCSKISLLSEEWSVKIEQMKTDFSAYSQTNRASKLKTATMGKKLNGRLFRVNGKPFRVNGELFRVHGKLFHLVFSSCEGSFLAIIGMFGWVSCRFQEAKLQ